MIMAGSTDNLFEGVEVYKPQGGIQHASNRRPD
jgi:hypothetical protein